MGLKMLVPILSIVMFFGNADAVDKVRMGVSNYNISNLTVGVAQTRGFFKQEGIDAEIIQRKDHPSCPGQARHEILAPVPWFLQGYPSIGWRRKISL